MTPVSDARLFELATHSSAFGPLFAACDVAATTGDLSPLRGALDRTVLCGAVPALLDKALRTLATSDLWSPRHGSPAQLPLYRSGTLSLGLMRLDPAEAGPLVLASSCNDMLIGVAGPAAVEVVAQPVDTEREALVGERREMVLCPGEAMTIPAQVLATSLSVSAATVVMLGLRSHSTAVARTFSPDGVLLEREVVHRDLPRARYLLHVLAHVGDARDVPVIEAAAAALAYPLEDILPACIQSLAQRQGETRCR